MKKTARKTCFVENIKATTTITTTTRQHRSVMFEENKENCFVKESEISINFVKQLKVYYEGFSDGHTNRAEIVNESQNTKAAGAIKKQKKLESLVDVERHKNNVPYKHPGNREDDVFAKSRFKIYTDDCANGVGKESPFGKSDEKSAKEIDKINTNKWEPYPRRRIVDQRLITSKLQKIDEEFRKGVTPTDVIPVLPTIKKVKALHRKSLSTNLEKQASASGCVSRNTEYELPYDDNFIEYELQKGKAVPNSSKNFRQRNITVEQRQIILKFLTRLHSHLFLPSLFLYQTVKLFDTVLDAKIVEVENLQLVALAAMWIALKREHLAYNVPTAQKMVSFAKDLYEGKVDMLLKCEMDILQTLNFNIVFPDPFSIMCYNITKCSRSEFMTSNEVYQAYCCGSYMIDLSLFDEDLMNTPILLLVAAASETALYFTMEKIDNVVQPLWYTWRAPHIAKRFTEEDISPVRKKLIQKIFESQKRHSDVEIVFKKYVRSRYGRISHFLGKRVISYVREE